MKEETTEEKIDKFLKEECFNLTDKEVDEMIIQRKMGFVNMKDLAKWQEFKMGLRGEGYII